MIKFFRSLFLFAVFITGLCSFLEGQNALVFNGGFAVQSGGTGPANGSYIVVNEPSVNGIIVTGSGGGIISESQFNYTSWINGGTASGSFVFPYYQSTTNSIPFTINKTSGATDMIVSTWGTPANNLPLAIANGNTLGTANGAYPTTCDLNSVYGGSSATIVDRWWDVNSAGAINGTLSFSYLGTENTPAYGSLYAQIWKSYSGTYQWTNPVFATSNAGVVVGIGNTTMSSSTLLTGFWVLGDQALILETQDISTSVQCKPEGAEINWTSSNETSYDYFTLEKSPDAVNFSLLAKIPAIYALCTSGCTGASYSFTDPAAVSGEYYRIKLVKSDGSEHLIKLLVYNCEEGSQEFSCDFYSNGNNSVLTLKNADSGNYTADFYDARGRKIFSEKRNIQKGNSFESFDLSELSEGIYFFRLTDTQGKVFSRKFVHSR